MYVCMYVCMYVIVGPATSYHDRIKIVSTYYFSTSNFGECLSNVSVKKDYALNGIIMY